MNKLIVFLCVGFLFGVSPICAEGPSILKNGTFEFSDKPEGWIIHSEEPTRDEWAKVVEAPDGIGRMVQLMAGPPKRYLAQDVKIEDGEGGLYVLRWKAKGEGTGSVSLLARDENDEFFKPSFEVFPVTGEFESYELSLVVPDEAVFVRVTIVADSPGSVVDFDELEFFRTD